MKTKSFVQQTRLQIPPTMRCAILSAAAVFLATVLAPAAVLIGWDPEGFTNSPDNQTGVWNLSTPVGTITLGSNVNLVTGFTRGSGVTSVSVNNTWGGSGVNQTSQANAITNGDFFYFTIQAASGFRLSLTDLNVTLRQYSQQYIWQYQVGSGSFTDIGTALTGTNSGATLGTVQPTLSISGVSALQNVTDTITLRAVAWTSGASTTFSIGRQTGNDLTINGTVSAVPEPSVYALIALGLIGAFLRRPRASKKPRIAHRSSSIESGIQS